MSISVDEEIPRHKPDNPFQYTPLQLATRSKALRDLKRDYPHLPDGWLEMVYDYNENTPKEEVEEVINSGKWDVPGKFSKSTGGSIVCGQIMDPSGNA